MTMMSPAAMRVNPFFLGGETIQVSYPTDTMSEEDSLMVMRGNGPHLSHATVFHELIPGHELQGFMAQRYNPHRGLFTHAVPHRRLGALLGIRDVGPGLPRVARGSDRRAVLAHAPLRPDRLLAELPPRALDAGAVRALPGRSRRPRSLHRRRRGPPLVQRLLLAALPGRLHDGRAADPIADEGARRLRRR